MAAQVPVQQVDLYHIVLRGSEPEVTLDTSSFRFPSLNRGKWFVRPLFAAALADFAPPSKDPFNQALAVRSAQLLAAPTGHGGRAADGSEDLILSTFARRAFVDAGRYVQWSEDEAGLLELTRPLDRIVFRVTSLQGKIISFSPASATAGTHYNKRSAPSDKEGEEEEEEEEEEKEEEEDKGGNEEERFLLGVALLRVREENQTQRDTQ